MGSIQCKNETRAQTPEDEIDALLNKYMSSRKPKAAVRKETSGLIKKIKRKSKEVAMKKAEAYVGNPVVPVEREVLRTRRAAGDVDWLEIVIVKQQTRFSFPESEQ